MFWTEQSNRNHTPFLWAAAGVMVLADIVLA
jgi:hypothetical protein